MTNEVVPDEDRGLYPKYRVIKIGEVGGPGNSMPGVPIRIAGAPVDEVMDSFFVLRFKDPHARVAILAYADSCEKTHPVLASDLRRQLHYVKKAS